MNYKNFVKNCLALSFLLLTLVKTDAQIKDAESLYEDYGYKTSTIIYEDLLGQHGEELSIDNMRKVANAYRLVHDTESAEIWYEKVIHETKMPLDYLHFAQVLQSNGKSNAAREYFLKYDEKKGGGDARGKRLAMAIDRMNQMSENTGILKNVSSINTQKLEFSPNYFEDGIVFVSTRKSSKGKARKDIWINDYYMSLFYAPLDDEGKLGVVREFSTQLNTHYHEGPVDFNNNADVIYFTRNNYNNKKVKRNSKNGVFLKIFTAKKEGANWSEAKELSFNTEDFDECHPTLFPDEKTMIFASNRTGGHGGMDLYLSNFENGDWSNPINLGPQVNTEGNEAFPFMHEDGTLYFASDGWGGIGGLDIFSTRLDGEKTQWLKPTNIGKPYNSPKDDFGFSMNVLGTEGYLSSAREGNDDIYSFVAPEGSINKPSANTIESTILARGKDGKQISDVAFTIIAKNMKTGEISEQVLTSNANGEIFMEVLPDHEYEFIANKEGYRQNSKKFSTEGMYNNDSLSIQVSLSEDHCIALIGSVNGLDDKLRLAKANIRLKNLCTNEEQLIQSNLIGEFELDCLDPNCAYEVIAEKENYGIASGRIIITEEQKNSAQKINLVFKLPPKISMPPNINEAVASNTDGFYEPSIPSTNDINREGALLQLDNIYYDFDKYDIRSDAAQTLDELVAIMRTYPDMKIELSAHTDAQGSEKYNQRLSRKRAEYAVWYLLKKGIKKSRMIYKGFGESQIRNHCTNKIDCSDDEHEYNRRTMIRIIR